MYERCGYQQSFFFFLSVSGIYTLIHAQRNNGQSECEFMNLDKFLPTENGFSFMYVMYFFFPIHLKLSLLDTNDLFDFLFHFFSNAFYIIN